MPSKLESSALSMLQTCFCGPWTRLCGPWTRRTVPLRGPSLRPCEAPARGSSTCCPLLAPTSWLAVLGRNPLGWFQTRVFGQEGGGGGGGEAAASTAAAAAAANSDRAELSWEKVWIPPSSDAAPRLKRLKSEQGVVDGGTRSGAGAAGYTRNKQRFILFIDPSEVWL